MSETSGFDLRPDSGDPDSHPSQIHLTFKVGERNTDFGKMLRLAASSAIHRSWSLADCERLFLPPIEHNQYLIADDGFGPVGFFTWAFLKPEARNGFLSRTRKLQPTDWTGGDECWAIDFVACGIDANELVRAFKSEFLRKYPDIKRVYLARSKGTGKVVKTGYIE
jgi:hemolysin-activating ACP:hemolysin acyltransferase